MIIHCNNCNNELHPTYLFCPFCGSEAPKKTIVGKIIEEKIKTPIFCPHCKKENLQQALFCSSCGEDLYSLPKGDFQYCPYCGEKNRTNARYCFKCSKNFANWYDMQADVADKLGHFGDLSLYETMTETYYNFITQGKITIGRLEDNDICIPCQWVSGKHCSFDISNQKLIDLNSANGTFINRSDNPIKNVTFSQTGEFNLASVFTFTVIKTKALFIFRLTAVLDEKECERVGNIQKINELRKHYFILVNGNDKIYIRKLDGKIITDPASSEIKKIAASRRARNMDDFYTINIKNQKYYFSELTKNIENKLILKIHNNIPVNWKILKTNQKIESKK